MRQIDAVPAHRPPSQARTQSRAEIGNCEAVDQHWLGVRRRA
ncbi:Uncharacterised protein [Vibrio cholerae]|nr:Uncharacterised protein [Vibrio cholerae]